MNTVRLPLSSEAAPFDPPVSCCGREARATVFDHVFEYGDLTVVVPQVHGVVCGNCHQQFPYSAHADEILQKADLIAWARETNNARDLAKIKRELPSDVFEAARANSPIDRRAGARAHR